MKKLYGKTVKSFLKQTLDGREITVAVINSGEWQDVHIIDPLYKEEELNTLYLQEPKDVVIYQKDLWQYLWSHFIWNKMYGVDNMVHHASVTIESEEFV